VRARFVAIALALLLPPAATALPGAVTGPVAERVARDGRVMVVVELTESVLPEGWIPEGEARRQRQRVIAAQIEAIYGLAGSDAGAARPYPVIPFMAIEVGPNALSALETSPFVRSVAVAEVYAPTLNESVPVAQVPEAWDSGFDGTGQVVVVVDTGTDLGHQNFAGKGVTEACFASGANNAGNPQSGGGDCPGGGDTAFGAGAAVPCDFHSQCFHGTHVAGIAVGEGADQDGVAIGSDLIPIQIFSEFPDSTPACGGAPCPLAWSFDQDAALLHVHDALRHDHAIAAVNLSLGSGAFTSHCDGGSQASTKAAIDQLRSVGIATVVSTGNNSCDGSGCTDAISAPACISSAVSVSAVGDDGTVRSWANRSDFTSLFAPGSSIGAPRFNTVSSFTWASGTSMAAPHVAGAFAILRQARPDPGATSVSDLLAGLQAGGLPVTLGVNRIRVRDALGQLGFPECDDGVDNDGDGFLDGADLGCDDTSDLFEVGSLPCDDGVDNDGDGFVDLADPGCFASGWPSESPACSDGVDNDGDGGIDFDGAPADVDCGSAWQDSEEAAVRSSCGLGPGLALALPLLFRLRRLRR